VFGGECQYGKQVLQKLHQRGIGVDLSVRSSYVGIQPDGTKVTSDTGVDTWKHKDTIILVSGCLLNKALAASTTVELLLF
jgi:hypothetical protein